MKARVKATGETIEIMQVYEKGESFYVRLDMLDTTEVRYHISELEFEGFETEGKFAETCLNGIKQGVDYIPDYWERIKHQAMIAAMQAIITNPIGFEHVRASNQGRCISEDVADIAKGYAADLVSKMKEE